MVSPRKFQTGERTSSPGEILSRLRSISAQRCLLFSLAHAAFINPIGACTATLPQKKTLFGSFSINHTSPSGSHQKYAPAWRYTPSDNLRSLIASIIFPCSSNRHINDSGVLRQRFTHCQTNPVFEGIPLKPSWCSSKAYYALPPPPACET